MTRDEMMALIKFAIDQIDWSVHPDDAIKSKFTKAQAWLEDEANKQELVEITPDNVEDNIDRVGWFLES
jgi:hypothetical protein